jgi:hypothetical protein
MSKLDLSWEKYIERQGDYVEKQLCQFVAKILYFTYCFRLFNYMVYFSRYFTVCITYRPYPVHNVVSNNNRIINNICLTHKIQRPLTHM